MGRFDGYVGVFDSGAGGISVLKALIDELPHERFAFFGDSRYTPYGDKPVSWVLERSRQITQGLLDDGCKAVVIACNTATSIAADALRAEFSDVPIVGIEPALKPAALAPHHRSILMMATVATVRLEKFQRLAAAWGSRSVVHAVGCEGLADRIERGNLDAPDLHELLERLVGEYRGRVDSVVLGCTHYPFVRRQIAQVVGDVPFYQGGPGTARQTRRRLAQAGLLAPHDQEGTVELMSSVAGPEQLDLYRWFLRQPL